MKWMYNVCLVVKLNYTSEENEKKKDIRVVEITMILVCHRGFNVFKKKREKVKVEYLTKMGRSRKDLFVIKHERDIQIE